MKFLIEMRDELNGRSVDMHTINVYRVKNSTPYTPGCCDLLERMPYMPSETVFETAITLACRLKTAGFDVDVVRFGGDTDES